MVQKHEKGWLEAKKGWSVTGRDPLTTGTWSANSLAKNLDQRIFHFWASSAHRSRVDIHLDFSLNFEVVRIEIEPSKKYGLFPKLIEKLSTSMKQVSNLQISLYSQRNLVKKVNSAHFLGEISHKMTEFTAWDWIAVKISTKSVKSRQFRVDNG